jgi:hypothetical protein
MEFLTRRFVTAREWQKGQATLAKCAMILAAVAIAVEVFVTYEVLSSPLPHL